MSQTPICERLLRASHLRLAPGLDVLVKALLHVSSGGLCCSAELAADDHSARLLIEIGGVGCDRGVVVFDRPPRAQDAAAVPREVRQMPAGRPVESASQLTSRVVWCEHRF